VVVPIVALRELALARPHKRLGLDASSIKLGSRRGPMFETSTTSGRPGIIHRPEPSSGSIVPGLLIGVGQELVRLLHPAEFARLAAWSIWVVRPGEAVIGESDILRGSTSWYAEVGVVVARGSVLASGHCKAAERMVSVGARRNDVKRRREAERKRRLL
jgi:hypothetical protein